MNKEEFCIEIKKLNITYTDEMFEKLDIYCKFLLDYNQHTNLTAIREEKEVYLKHFYDSLTLAKGIDLKNVTSMLDIGSGAGFPGIVIKIFFPNIKVSLIDSNNKKTTFLKQVVDKLGLINVDVINDRVENFSKNNLNSFDLVTARAVTYLPVLAELALPIVKKDGLFIAMKGKSDEELANGAYAISIMGGSIENVICFELPCIASERSLIVVKKNRITKLEEIRSYEKIIKKPLQRCNK